LIGSTTHANLQPAKGEGRRFLQGRGAMASQRGVGGIPECVTPPEYFQKYNNKCIFDKCLTRCLNFATVMHKSHAFNEK
jgi:hypothetical protein